MISCKRMMSLLRYAFRFIASRFLTNAVFRMKSMLRKAGFVEKLLYWYVIRLHYHDLFQRPSPDVKGAIFDLLHHILLRRYRYFFPSQIIASLLTDEPISSKGGNISHKSHFLAIMAVSHIVYGLSIKHLTRSYRRAAQNVCFEVCTFCSDYQRELDIYNCFPVDLWSVVCYLIVALIKRSDFLLM